VITFLAIPIFGLLAILQSAILSRMPLLQGTADLVLLVVIAWALQERVRSAWQWALIAGIIMAYVSALSGLIPIGSYLVVTALALFLRQRVWQVPVLAMLAVTFIGSLLVYSLTALYLSITGTPLPFVDTLYQIILPSIILNLLLAIPVYALVKDLSEWLYPEEIDL